MIVDPLLISHKGILTINEVAMKLIVLAPLFWIRKNRIGFLNPSEHVVSLFGGNQCVEGKTVSIISRFCTDIGLPHILGSGIRAQIQNVVKGSTIIEHG